MTKHDRVLRAAMLWGGFYRCPVDPTIIMASLHGDDKFLCSCGRSNPRVPQEHPGVHLVRFCTAATAAEFVDYTDKVMGVTEDKEGV